MTSSSPNKKEIIFDGLIDYDSDFKQIYPLQKRSELYQSKIPKHTKRIKMFTSRKFFLGFLFFIINEQNFVRVCHSYHIDDSKHFSNDSEQLDDGFECFEHFHCLSLERNPEHLQNLKINSTLPNWFELCNCDQSCHLFGDCCLDTPHIEQLDLDHWSFVRVRFGSKINFLTLMKSRCPNEWIESDFVRNQCEASYYDSVFDWMLSDIEQYLLLTTDEEFNNWHVTSRRSLITYRNIYCSVCNDDNETDSWSQRMLCLEDGRCTATYHQFAPEILGKAKLKRSPLQSKVYSGCNLGWYKLNYQQNQTKTLQTIKNCLIYYAPIVARDFRTKKFIIFKNRFCAECNNLPPSTFQCAHEKFDRVAHSPSSYNQIRSFDTNYQAGGILANESDLNKLHNEIGTDVDDDVGGENSSNKFHQCPSGFVHNPINGLCQKIFDDNHADPHPILPELIRSHSSNNIFSFKMVFLIVSLRLIIINLMFK